MNEDDPIQQLKQLALASFFLLSGCSGEATSAKEQSSPDPQCPTQPPQTTPTDPSAADADQDGVTLAAGDCDDFNNTIFPGAPETGWDSVDSDCDGEDGPLVTAEHPGQVPFETFATQCLASALLDGSANPGVVQLHAACAGSNYCRGMSYGDWGEGAILSEHSCRAMNGCNGWSCVETGDGQGRTGQAVYDESCSYCHGWNGPLVSTDEQGNEVETPQFTVMVPPGRDPAAHQAAFAAKPDEAFRSAIAFGLTGATTSGLGYSNMPAFHKRLSRAEIDAVIAYVRTLPLTTHTFTHPDGSVVQ